MAKAIGNGSIIEKARGVWEVQVSLGRDPITGKYPRKSRTVRGTKAEARRVRDQIRRELEDGLKVEADKVTLRQFSKEFIAAKRASGKASRHTIDRDEAKLNFMCEMLGDMPLKSIDARTVETLYREIRKRREAQGRRCGNTTLHSYHVILKALMRKAVDYDLISRNPCDRVDAPPVDKASRKGLPTEDAAILLAHINAEEKRAVNSLIEKEGRQRDWGASEDRSYLLGMRDVCYILAVRVGLATGMRLGEVLAITWGAADFERSQISVAQSLGPDMLPKVPKTEAGRRTVAVDAVTMAHLKAWKALQADLLDDLCLTVDDTTPAFCSATGGWLDKSNFQRWWRVFRENAGFPTLKFHELRHTQATQLLANGIDLKTIQSRLGHAKASITLDFYAHAVPENDEKAARLIGNLFQSDSKQPEAIPLPKGA
ncbi:tyrosine-type recombinase/integrase [Adlercreutzia caecimuris]|uniref:tyrosine-type recombinase/integrase n=1 Tax=Adlercreutzia caecimuris TaxID=671266 RepID=UPI001C3DEFF7|nr:site-specific integrase [Adlercreutzia caecimuris]MCR2038281.1 site-specific integrase [Adlercreutzia caecimuris]